MSSDLNTMLWLNNERLQPYIMFTLRLDDQLSQFPIGMSRILFRKLLVRAKRLNCCADIKEDTSKASITLRPC